MNDSTRFALAKTGTVVAGVAGALMLTACSGGSPVVSGRLTGTHWAPRRPAVTTVATHHVPVYTNHCTTKYHTVTTGSGAFKKTSTKSYQSCGKVRTGYRTEHYTRTLVAAKPEMYCVELNRVNGRNWNYRWYEVSYSTYRKMLHKLHGTQVNKMHYYQQVSSCSN